MSDSTKTFYAAGSENRPPMLNKENYVPWSSCLLRRMIMERGDAVREVPVPERFMNKTDDELTEAEMYKDGSRCIKTIRTFFSGLSEDILCAVVSVKLLRNLVTSATIDEGSISGIHEKKANWFIE
ncbi:hypothetical protein Tco_0969828 [Tanacetum coccineum]